MGADFLIEEVDHVKFYVKARFITLGVPIPPTTGKDHYYQAFKGDVFIREISDLEKELL